VIAPPRAVGVLHLDPLVADALASALERYPELQPVVVGSDLDALEQRPLDAVALDGALPGASAAASSLRRAGVRVVVMAGGTERPAARGDDGPPAPPGSVQALAHALAPEAGTAHRNLDLLSHREREVLGLAAQGLAAKQIAARMGISAKTVEAHKSKIFDKLGVRSQTAAVALMTSGEGVPAWTR
jgi:DNA-binding CsgD family transcriptional regulator